VLVVGPVRPVMGSVAAMTAVSLFRSVSLFFALSLRLSLSPRVSLSVSVFPSLRLSLSRVLSLSFFFCFLCLVLVASKKCTLSEGWVLHRLGQGRCGRRLWLCEVGDWAGLNRI
jgi:hypothetical protein